LSREVRAEPGDAAPAAAASKFLSRAFCERREAHPEKLEANVQTKLVILSAGLAAILLSGCATEVRGPGVGVGVGVGDYYDGYYDGYYGPFVDGYWGDDGNFWYADRDHHWRRDGGHHFSRIGSTGFVHIHGSGVHRQH
jgi:hypothetical protein